MICSDECYVRPKNIGIKFCLKKDDEDWFYKRSSLSRNNRMKWIFTYGLRSPRKECLAYNRLNPRQGKLQIQLFISTHFSILFSTTIDCKKALLKARLSCKIQPEYRPQSKQEKPSRHQGYRGFSFHQSLRTSIRYKKYDTTQNRHILTAKKTSKEEGDMLDFMCLSLKFWSQQM